MLYRSLWPDASAFLEDMALADGPLNVTRVAGFSGSVFLSAEVLLRFLMFFVSWARVFVFTSVFLGWPCEHHLQRLVGWFGLVDHVKGEKEG